MAATSLSIKAIRTDPHHGDVRELYALVQWHTHEENNRSFDISLTDCSHAWHVQGGRPEGAPRLREEAWIRAKQALSDAPGTAGSSYEYWIDERNGQCKLFWQWSSQGAGKDVLFVTLGPAEAVGVIRSMMEHMMASYSYMKTALSVSSEAQARLEKSLAAKDIALRNELQAGRKREEELFLKFALLQNRQTAEHKRLRAELDHYQQELKRLQGENEVDTDDEALAAAYGAAYEADTEDESDDVGGEGGGGAVTGAAAAAVTDRGIKFLAPEPKASAAHLPGSASTAVDQHLAVQDQEAAAPSGVSFKGVRVPHQPTTSLLGGRSEGATLRGGSDGGRGPSQRKGLAGLAQRFLLDDEAGDGQQQPGVSQQAAAFPSGSAAGGAATNAATAGGAAAEHDEKLLPADIDMMDAETQPLDPLVLQQEYLKHQQCQQRRQQEQHQQQQHPQLHQQQQQHMAVPPAQLSGQQQPHEQTPQQQQQQLQGSVLPADDGEPAAIVSRARRRRR